jgi:hypothetical protein
MPQNCEVSGFFFLQFGQYIPINAENIDDHNLMLWFCRQLKSEGQPGYSHDVTKGYSSPL